MFIPVILISCTISGCIVGVLSHYKSFGNKLESGLFGVLTSVLGFFIGILIIMITSTFVDIYAETQYEYNESRSVQLYALQDSKDTTSSFFLGIGGSNENLNVYYVTKIDNILRVNKRDIRDINIVETDDEISQIKIKELKFTNETIKYWFGKPLNRDVEEFYIPKNSITKDFNIDLK